MESRNDITTLLFALMSRTKLGTTSKHPNTRFGLCLLDEPKYLCLESNKENITANAYYREADILQVYYCEADINTVGCTTLCIICEKLKMRTS